MSRPRRRTSAGLSLGVIIALFVAVFGSRAQRQPAPSPAAASRPAAAAPSARVDADAGLPASTASARTPGFTSRRSLEEHYDKHGAEFPGLSMAAYLAAAQTLRDAPVSDVILEVQRSDGVITRFDKSSGAFLAANRDGTIRTFFRPNDGEAYFRRQATRLPESGR